VNAAVETPFIGHADLLVTLSDKLRQVVQEKHDQKIALIGHNGVGKTRIARQVATMARMSDFRVAWVTCSRRDTHRTIFQKLIGQLLNIKPEDDSTLLQERLHEFHLLDFEEGLRELLLDDPSLGSCMTVNTFAALLVRFFNTFATQSPTLLIIDDLQREHSGGLDILNKTLQAVTRTQLFVLVLVEPPFAPHLGLEEFELSDLNADEIEHLAMNFLSVPTIGSRLKALLWDKTHGRPMYVEAFLRSLSANGCIQDGELDPNADSDLLPDDLREAVMSRVDSLPIDAQIVLRAAAVLGDQFTPEALSVVSELHDEVQVREILHDLINARMIEHVDEWLYAFRQDLTRGAIYVSLARSLRIKLHRLAANYWRSHRTIKDHHSSLAFHLIKCGLLPQAIEVLSNAGEEAEKRGDLSAALSIYEDALQHLPNEKDIVARIEALRQRL